MEIGIFVLNGLFIISLYLGLMVNVYYALS